MKVRVARAARVDIQQAHDWYEDQRPGLGEAFESELEEVMARISSFPAAHRKAHGDARRALLRRFPYAIYYSIETDGKGAAEIVALRVLHLRRHPRHWPKV